MASIRERTKQIRKGDGVETVTVFNVQVRMQGYPARTATFSNRRKAERWATTIEAQMIEGKHFRGTEGRRKTLADAIDRYLEEEVPKKKGGGMHKAALPWWKARIGHLKLADVTPAVLAEQRGKLAAESFTRTKPASKRSLTRKDGFTAKAKKKTSSSVNRYLSVPGHLFSVARKEWHWIAHNPFDGVAKLREGKGRTRYISDDERTRLLAQTINDPTLHLLVVLALSTAARAGELTGLQWKDVDLKEGRLLFRDTKNTETRAAWLYGDALRLLKDHAKVRHLHKDDVFPRGKKTRYDYAKPFAAAIAAAEIADFRFHDLRHSAATYLAMQGATEQQLRAIGGWKSGIVSRYVHLAATDAKSAMQKLSDKVDGKSLTPSKDPS
jgi:integrase